MTNSESRVCASRYHLCEELRFSSFASVCFQWTEFVPSFGPESLMNNHNTTCLWGILLRPQPWAQALALQKKEWALRKPSIATEISLCSRPICIHAEFCNFMLQLG